MHILPPLTLCQTEVRWAWRSALCSTAQVGAVSHGYGGDAPHLPACLDSMQISSECVQQHNCACKSLTGDGAATACIWQHGRCLGPMPLRMHASLSSRSKELGQSGSVLLLHLQRQRRQLQLQHFHAQHACAKTWRCQVCIAQGDPPLPVLNETGCRQPRSQDMHGWTSREHQLYGPSSGISPS